MGTQKLLFPCPNCDESLTAPPSDAGLRIQCRSCGTAVVIPGAEDDEEEPSEDETPKEEDYRPVRRRTLRTDNDEERDYRSRPQKYKSNDAVFWAVMNPLMLAATAASVGAIIVVLAAPIVGLICVPIVVMISAACLTLGCIAFVKGHGTPSTIVVIVFSALVVIVTIIKAAKATSERSKDSHFAGISTNRGS